MFDRFISCTPTNRNGLTDLLRVRLKIGNGLTGFFIMCLKQELVKSLVCKNRKLVDCEMSIKSLHRYLNQFYKIKLDYEMGLSSYRHFWYEKATVLGGSRT